MVREGDEEKRVLGHLLADIYIFSERNNLESMNIAGLGTAGEATELLPPIVSMEKGKVDGRHETILRTVACICLARELNKEQ